MDLPAPPPELSLFDVTRAQERALEALIPALDIVEGRAEGATPPAWCEARGWTEFLLAMSDQDLSRCEAEGLAPYVMEAPGAPASLVALGRETTLATSLPELRGDRLAAPSLSLRSVSARKRPQLGALLFAVREMAGAARRIVDVGAGRGHFTRLASALFDREALGLDREPARVAAAEALAGESAARFATFDACAEELSFAPDDLAVGLHACGEVGDRLTLAAARAGCDVALISCCLQKLAGPARAPLSRAARAAGLTLRRETLGLTNLTARAQGVEGSLSDTMAARENRHALLHLLRARGAPVDAGAEMRGINRRRAHDGLGALAARALAQRGLRPASAAELEDVAAQARAHFARVRRLSLPRSMLARLTEVAVVLDRAAALADAGHAAQVAILVDAGVTPRNLAIFASRSPARLPGS